MVLRGRVDVALITRSNLTELLARNPKIKSQVLVSQRIDQIYHHYALLRPKAPIAAPQLAALLQQLRDNGQIKAIFEPFQVAVVPMRRPLAEVLP